MDMATRKTHLMPSELLDAQLFCFPVARANTLSLWLVLAGTGYLALAAKKVI